MHPFPLSQNQTDISHCNFLVDSYFPGSEESALEPHYVLQSDAWEQVKCEPFLDVGATSLVGRLVWTPASSSLPKQFQRKWGQYCLLKQKT